MSLRYKSAPIKELLNNIYSTPVSIKITFNPDINTEALQYFL
jgi:hypothetical protein